MTREQLMAYIQMEHKQRSIWLKNAEIMKDVATQVEPLDPTLATLLRRMSLGIEQFQERISGYMETGKIEAQDAAEEEDETLIARLLADAKSKSTSSN